jgi:integrase
MTGRIGVVEALEPEDFSMEGGFLRIRISKHKMAKCGDDVAYIVDLRTAGTARSPASYIDLMINPELTPHEKIFPSQDRLRRHFATGMMALNAWRFERGLAPLIASTHGVRAGCARWLHQMG